MARKAASAAPEQGTLFEDRFLEDYAGQIMRDPVRRGGLLLAIETASKSQFS